MAVAVKRGREICSDDDDNGGMKMSKIGRMRFDERDIQLKINKLQRSNVRRSRKIREMERRIYELEKVVSELQERVSFLDAVAKDHERENNYFRQMYHFDGE